MADIFDAGRCGRMPLPSIIGQQLIADCHIPDAPRPITGAHTYLLLLQPPVAVGAMGPVGPRGSKGSNGSNGSNGSDGTQVYLGQVTGGDGNVWNVEIFPDGPHGSSGAFAATVNILNQPPTDDWIDPIERFAGEYYYARPGCGKLASTPMGGIPGTVLGIPQSARCTIYRFNGVSLTTIGSADVYSSVITAIGGSKLIQIKNIDGFWFCDVEAC